jgi:hypothetical protein
METLPALSFWQPYAWLIVNGHAEVDSRTWAPVEKRLGTRIAIHASKKKLTRASYEEFLGMIRNLKIKDYPKSPDDFDYGAVVGTVKLVGVTKTSKSYWAAPGYFHWLLENPRKLKPLPMKGQRGWFQVKLPSAK